MTTNFKPADQPSAPADGSARREALVAKVKRDIRNVARIYPTAFNLYDEPLDRLARRVVATMEAQNDKLTP